MISSISSNIDAKYVYIYKWGSHGGGPGEFNNPRGLDVDSSGNVFVADSGNNRIQLFQLAKRCPVNTMEMAVKGVCFVTEWGSHGGGPGEFNNPRGLDVDSSGNVFVADSGNNRIQEFKLANPCPKDSTAEVVPGVCLVIEWGSFGTSNGQFKNPSGVNVDSSGNVFVADTDNHRIQKFQLTDPCPGGSQVKIGVCFIQKLGSRGPMGGLAFPLGTALPEIEPGEFEYPEDVVFDTSGNVFVADTNDHRIQLFQLAKRCPVNTMEMAVKGVCFVTEWGTLGVDQGQFHYSPRVALDSLGHIYVVDSQNHRIQKFQLADPTNFKCPSGTTSVPRGSTQDVSGACFIEEWGNKGSGDGKLQGPWDLAVEPSGIYVFVADTGNNRIQIFKDDSPFTGPFTHLPK